MSLAILNLLKSVPLYVGFVLGISLVFGAIFWLGRRFFKRLDLEDRGEWDRPLPHRFSKDMVVAKYKRQKQGHRHHRDYYRHHRPDGPEAA